ncbi:MAG: adenylosuccinate synthase [Gemmatimonadota bacterium]|nr:MAG: adenylosuccinate synthase [Gemmatimonadota bacterium]
MFADGARCVAVVGAQWGDEGKGKLIDVLAEQATIVARYQGGANAGHTVRVGEAEFILHLIPSGALYPDVRCLLGNGVVVDPWTFLEERDELVGRGLDLDGRLGISGRAHLVMPYHKMLDAALETGRGGKAIGTTGRGIGPAYRDKAARTGLRVADLSDPERCARVVERCAEAANATLARQQVPERVDPEQVLAALGEIGEQILALRTDVGGEIRAALRGGGRVLLEGAQGALLDVDHGTYPYVTSSSTTAGGAATGAGIGPTAIDEVLGVVKAYTTRVGNGPLPTELEGREAERLRELGGEFGATTGRPRRPGWFDGPVVRYAAGVNGLTALAITKLDVLDSFETLKLATDYELDGRRLTGFPELASDLERVTPVYETLPGWGTSTAACRRLEDLPEAARRYLRRIEEVAATPIRYVSVGSARDQTIRVAAARA